MSPSGRCYRPTAAIPAQETLSLTTVEQVESSIGALVGRLTDLDPSYRAMLPARRVIEATCTDLDLMYHARWRFGQLGELVPGAAARPDIRIHVASTDLLQLADGTLPFRQAWADQRVRVDASLADLWRLRAVL